MYDGWDCRINIFRRNFPSFSSIPLQASAATNSAEPLAKKRAVLLLLRPRLAPQFSSPAFFFPSPVLCRSKPNNYHVLVSTLIQYHDQVPRMVCETWRFLPMQSAIHSKVPTDRSITTCDWLIHSDIQFPYSFLTWSGCFHSRISMITSYWQYNETYSKNTESSLGRFSSRPN